RIVEVGPLSLGDDLGLAERTGLEGDARQTPVDAGGVLVLEAASGGYPARTGGNGLEDQAWSVDAEIVLTRPRKDGGAVHPGELQSVLGVVEVILHLELRFGSGGVASHLRRIGAAELNEHTGHRRREHGVAAVADRGDRAVGEIRVRVPD